MESGALWIGIVAPAMAVIVSSYLVWRAVRDERRFSREDAVRGERFPHTDPPADDPPWKRDPYAWMEDLEEWRPNGPDGSSGDAGWPPDAEGHGDR